MYLRRGVGRTKNYEIILLAKCGGGLVHQCTQTIMLPIRRIYTYTHCAQMNAYANRVGIMAVNASIFIHT